MRCPITATRAGDPGELPSAQQDRKVTVATLVSAYRRFAKDYYRGSTEVENFELSVKPLLALYGKLLASDFGPIKLKSVRQKMIEADMCRNEINKRMKRLFRWATEHELLSPTIYHRAIRTACQKAKVPAWHPHQLRHNAATWLRKEFGLDVARVVLGHRSPAITEQYAELDFGKARDVMSRVG